MRRGRPARWVALGLFALLLALGGAGWWAGRRFGLWEREREPVVVSPEAAEHAAQKLAGLREGGGEVELTATEISSLLRYRSPAWVLETVREPTVALSGDTLVLIGQVPTDRLPPHPDLDRVRALLPDTSSIEVSGHLRPLERGQAALEITAVEFAGLPVPARYYPQVLERMGRRDRPGLSRSAVALRLPSGAASARVEAGRLVLTP